ncbi:MAG TPA: ketoacyl-ACP synthase III [Polyangiaceae bacterium]|nr:ketoacyl-ACP synthase III [Polyangiaceae bacterium]
MAELCVTGLGVYLPQRLVNNRELPELDPPHTLADMDKVGVRARGIAAEHESVLYMAEQAARRALDRAGVAAESLDFLILANWSERRYVPDFAPRVQHALGARRAFALDVGCACAGFIYGLTQAHGYLQNSRFSRGLVLASDRSTQRLRPRSRATLVFGDAAAAMVVERDAMRGSRLLDYELHTDGSQNDIMEVDADGYLLPKIKQRELNQLAGKSLASVSRALLERNQLSVDDIDWFVPHSGTAGVQAMLAEHLGAPPEKTLTTLADIGNVTSSSIPVSLHHFLEAGKIKPGDRVLSAAVGLGWQYCAVLYRV